MDFKLASVPGGGVDLAVVAGDLQMDPGLATSALASLWTDARADADDLGDLEDDPRGYWADREGDRWGSRLWLLDRSKATTSSLREAEESAEASLSWMKRNGVARRVRAVATFLKPGWLHLDIRIDRDRRPRWDSVWAGTLEDYGVDGERVSFRLLFT